MKAVLAKTRHFLDPSKVLDQVSLKEGSKVADFGSGNGYYTIAAAKLVGSEGQVFALDIQETALSQTASQAKLEGVYNVVTKQCNFEEAGSCQIDDTSVDLVILSSVLHLVQNPENVLREAYRVLKTGGQVLVVEWKMNALIGPEKEQRIGEERLSELLQKFSFRPVKQIEAGAFHNVFLFTK